MKGQTANANSNAIGQDAIDGCVLVGNENITFPDSRNVPTFLTFGGRQSAIGICDSIAAAHLGPLSTSMSRIPSRKSTPSRVAYLTQLEHMHFRFQAKLISQKKLFMNE